MTTALQLARHANRAWVVVYTAGLTDAQKRDRRDEIASDVYEHELDFRAEGTGSAVIGRQIASRMVRGMLADVVWRYEAGREGERVAATGESPPLPWLTMAFISAVIVAGSFASTQASLLGEAFTMLSIASIVGAGAMWLGLHLATHRFAGPLLIGVGSLVMAWTLYWTFVGPVAAVVAGIAGVRRAQRIEALRMTY